MKHQTAAEDQRSADLTSGSPAVNFRFSSNNLYLEAMRGDETAQTPNWSQLKRRDVNRERSEEGVSSHFDSARPVGGRQQNKRHRGSCSLPSEHWVCGGVRQERFELRVTRQATSTTNQQNRGNVVSSNVQVSSWFCSRMVVVHNDGSLWEEPRSPDQLLWPAPHRWRTN